MKTDTKCSKSSRQVLKKFDNTIRPRARLLLLVCLCAVRTDAQEPWENSGYLDAGTSDKMAPGQWVTYDRI